MRCRPLAAALLSSLVPSSVLISPGAPVAPSPPRRGQEGVDAALDKGVAFLRESYRNRLERDQLGEERVGQSALALYTLLECGTSVDDEVVRRLMAHVMFQRIKRTYDAACALLAASAFDAIGNRRWIAALAHQLLGWQSEHGDWSYPAVAEGDLSNTQYAALGLWAASRAGVRIDGQAWARLATAVLEYQVESGGFGYMGGTSSGSMTAAGCGVLAICERELRLARRWDDHLAASIPVARRRGLDWLAANFSVTANPPGGGWLYYYLYGLERLGALAGIERIGEHDWYEEGAASLVGSQGSDGAWNHDNNVWDTCFALLFLERATSAGPRRGPITGDDAGPPPVGAFQIAAAGDGPTRVWIDSWSRKAVGNIEWPRERGHGPRVAWVEYLADERTVAIELGDPTRPAEGARFPIEHVFTGEGKHRVRARAVVLAPGPPSREEVLESQSLEVEASRTWPRWIHEEREDLGPDLLTGVKTKASASSVARGKSTPLGRSFPAELAIDGQVQTPWLADDTDERRELTILLDRSVEADVIRVAPAVFPPLGLDYLARPIEIGIEINLKDEHRLAMDPDPTHAMRIELERPVAIRRLDLRILSVAKSPASSVVGLNEVELFLRDE